MVTARDASSLRVAVRDPGFTPAARDVPSLVALLGDDDDTGPILRALERVAAPATAFVLRHFDGLPAAARARACEFIGRMARADATLATWLVERLGDADALTRRRAITALGKLEDPRHEGVLLAAWSRASSDPERKAVATALGQAGADAALESLRAQQPDDPELARVVREAVLKLERAGLRARGTTIALDVPPPAAVDVDLQVRPGLEALLCAELDGAAPRVRARGLVRVRWHDALQSLFAARTFVQLGFPLPPVRIAGPTDEALEDAVVRALAGEPAWRIFSAFTQGPLRWRLEWKHRGHRRGSTWRVIEALGLLRPELVNDPREAPWEAQVEQHRDQLHVTLLPRGLVDPRFAWRRGSVPASSHPTVAAALARVAGARPDDVVWDPFVGAGAELVERALLGRFAALLGTDLDAAAIATATANLHAAGITGATLVVADACTYRPPRAPDLIITNPPMGHRVRGERPIAQLLAAALDHWLAVLAPGGRIVWLSPLPELARARRDVRVISHQSVDLGGLAAQLQVLEAAAPPPRTREDRRRRR